MNTYEYKTLKNNPLMKHMSLDEILENTEKHKEKKLPII